MTRNCQQRTRSHLFVASTNLVNTNLISMNPREHAPWAGQTSLSGAADTSVPSAETFILMRRPGVFNRFRRFLRKHELPSAETKAANQNTESLQPYRNAESLQPNQNAESLQPNQNAESLRPYQNAESLQPNQTSEVSDGMTKSTLAETSKASKATKASKASKVSSSKASSQFAHVPDWRNSTSPSAVPNNNQLERKFQRGRKQRLSESEKFHDVSESVTLRAASMLSPSVPACRNSTLSSAVSDDIHLECELQRWRKQQMSESEIFYDVAPVRHQASLLPNAEYVAWESETLTASGLLCPPVPVCKNRRSPSAVSNNIYLERNLRRRPKLQASNSEEFRVSRRMVAGHEVAPINNQASLSPKVESVASQPRRRPKLKRSESKKSRVNRLMMAGNEAAPVSHQTPTMPGFERLAITSKSETPKPKIEAVRTKDSPELKKSTSPPKPVWNETFGILVTQ